MSAGMRRRRSLWVSWMDLFRSKTVGSSICLRLKASSCRVNEAALWVAVLISATVWRTDSLWFSSWPSRSLYPIMTPR